MNTTEIQVKSLEIKDNHGQDCTANIPQEWLQSQVCTINFS